MCVSIDPDLRAGGALHPERDGAEVLPGHERGGAHAAASQYTCWHGVRPCAVVVVGDAALACQIYLNGTLVGSPTLRIAEDKRGSGRSLLWHVLSLYPLGVKMLVAAVKRLAEALLHESSRARTMPTDRILTGRCDMTLVGRARSSD